MKRLVIVESPTKAKTIRKFLPDSYQVDSSYGHIRDLPANAKEVPAKYKKEKWANLGINVDAGFEPLYVISSEKKKVVTRLKELLAKADELILATDEDREGEAIAWHIREILNPKVPVKRMVFHEITEEAIKNALQQFRQVDEHLVDAQETRRVLDRLAGYTVSPLLWKKIASGLSAGRVQSVAVELIVQRERDRIRFRSGSYWDLKAHLLAPSSPKSFTADLIELGGKRLATGKDFDENTGRLAKPNQVVLLDEAAATALRERLMQAKWTVAEVETTEQVSNPKAPFTTSTLQQEANRKFGMSAKDTMRTAQKLYEEGFITYMRTDSTNLSGQAIGAARTAVEQMYGADYLSKKPRQYATSAKGAQEAHEAIRPAGNSFRLPATSGLTGAALKLYDLIWKRTIATQMAEARTAHTTARIEATTSTETAVFRASGKEILFPGFFRAYVEGTDDPAAELEDQDKPLPKLAKADVLKSDRIEALAHSTKPPARYTEASLVKKLESEGVGRPSTYASIIETIQYKYVHKEGNQLVPNFLAFAVTELLEKHFPDLVNIQFTAAMEAELDEIAHGKLDRVAYLTKYYLGEKGLQTQVERQDAAIKPAEAKRVNLPIEGLDGVEILVGKFGVYAKIESGGEVKNASIPETWAPADLTLKKLEALLDQAQNGPQSLGKDPETGLDVFVLNGKFGPYVQLGDAESAGEKPKRASLLKGMDAATLSLETALSLLTLPRSLGKHPGTGKDVKASQGKFGPYVVHDGEFRSVKAPDDVLTISLERALELLAQPKTGKGAKTKGTTPAGKDIGTHPDTGIPIQLLDGKYGPYIKYGKKNISLKKGADPTALTLSDALAYIRAKAD